MGHVAMEYAEKKNWGKVPSHPQVREGGILHWEVGDTLQQEACLWQPCPKRNLGDPTLLQLCPL